MEHASAPHWSGLYGHGWQARGGQKRAAGFSPYLRVVAAGCVRGRSTGRTKANTPQRSGGVERRSEHRLGQASGAGGRGQQDG